MLGISLEGDLQVELGTFREFDHPLPETGERPVIGDRVDVGGVNLVPDFNECTDSSKSERTGHSV
jgi:hypothetical protein